MKKKILVTLVAVSAILNLWAQDATVKDLQKAADKDVKASDTLLNGWTHSGTFNLNLNQGSLQNWSAGGEQNSFGISGILNYALNYRNGKNTWDNYFDLALGFQNATSFNRLRKIDDRIDITSKYGHQVSKHWYVAGLSTLTARRLQDMIMQPTQKFLTFLHPEK